MGREPSQGRRGRSLATAFCLLVTLPALALPPPGVPRVPPVDYETYADSMLAGGPGKDGIPAIDHPRFSDAASAESFLTPADIVFGVYHHGQARAYPQRILVWHEIVNDSLGGEGLSITYCPLTATAVGFKRGDTTFGVSGKLLNSNVVMYDRASDSHWSQIAGIAIDGNAKGHSLAEVRVVWTTWSKWKSRYPHTQVLTRATGALRNYNRDPYGSYGPVGGYYASPAPLFPVMHSDNRLSAKQMVLGFRTGQIAVAVERSYLQQQGSVPFQHGDEHFLIIWDEQLETGWVYRASAPIQVDLTSLRFTEAGPQAAGLAQLDQLNVFDAMWFAWYAFYPQTVLLNGSEPTR